MQKALFTLLFLFVSAVSNACCGAGQTRVFPLGTINDQPICAVFQLTRDCRRGEFVFHDWFGTVKLEKWDGKEFLEISKVDTVAFLECECTPDTLAALSDYLNQLKIHLMKAHELAEKMQGFEAFQTDKLISDTMEMVKFGFTKSEKYLFFKKKKIHEFSMESLACEYMNGIKEVRTYSNSKGKWAIATIGCYDGNELEGPLEIESKENFKDIKTSVTYIWVEWHGMTQDTILRLE